MQIDLSRSNPAHVTERTRSLSGISRAHQNHRGPHPLQDPSAGVLDQKGSNRQKWLESPYNSDKHRFFKPLAITWELLIYDRLQPGSADENIAAIHISDAYKLNPTIQLERDTGTHDRRAHRGRRHPPSQGTKRNPYP